jgi:hypothetical protein
VLWQLVVTQKFWSFQCNIFCKSINHNTSTFNHGAFITIKTFKKYWQYFTSGSLPQANMGSISPPHPSPILPSFPYPSLYPYPIPTILVHCVLHSPNHLPTDPPRPLVSLVSSIFAIFFCFGSIFWRISISLSEQMNSGELECLSRLPFNSRSSTLSSHFT